MWNLCPSKSLRCLLYPPACPPSQGSGHLCSKTDWRCTSLRCIEPVLSASFFTFDSPASEAVLKVLCKKWKEAVTNWKSRGLKSRDHRSSFPVSLLCSNWTSRSNRCTPVRWAVKWARKVPSNFADRVVVKIFRDLLQKCSTEAQCAFLGNAGQLCCVICA